MKITLKAVGSTALAVMLGACATTKTVDQKIADAAAAQGADFAAGAGA